MSEGAAAAPTRGRRLRSLLGGLVGLAVVGAIFVAAGELLARGMGMVDRLNGYTRVLFAPGPSPELPYLLRPLVQTPLGGVHIRVNALGMRGAEVAAPAPGTIRVLMLGDSVVFGQGIAEAETVAAHLEAELGSHAIAGQVLNAGVQGYDTAAEAALFARLGPALRPDVVVVGMSLNDYDSPPRYHPVGVLARDDGAATDSFASRSEFILLLRWCRAWLRGELWHQRLARPGAVSPTAAAGVDTMIAAEHRRFYAAPAPDAWERLRTGVRGLRDHTDRLGARLLIAILPESWQIADTLDAGQPQERLLALCAEERVACLDLLPTFRAAGGGLFTDTQHPSAAGHAVAARAIASLVGSGR